MAIGLGLPPIRDEPEAGATLGQPNTLILHYRSRMSFSNKCLFV
jgi:hypothetical protein